MSIHVKPSRSTPPADAVHASLRAWAQGAYGDEAAVELLIRSFDGRFALPGWPWIALRQQLGEFWLDAETIYRSTGHLSGGEQRLLCIVASLAGTERMDRSLADLMSGVDRENQALVLAALSHVGESNQHNDCRGRTGENWALLPPDRFSRGPTNTRPVFKIHFHLCAPQSAPGHTRLARVPTDAWTSAVVFRLPRRGISYELNRERAPGPSLAARRGSCGSTGDWTQLDVPPRPLR